MASVFSSILAGELPGHFVWKDDRAFAIMTIEPIRPGHVLVIPREEVDHWDDLPEELACHLMVVAQRIARGLKVAFPSRRVGMALVGLEVPHTHIHLYPIDAMSDFSFARARAAGAEELAAAAEKIRQALVEQGCREAELSE